MKVVILHQHFKSPDGGGAIRSWYLGRALVMNGISVSIITAHNEKKYQRKNVDGIDVHYLPVAYDNKFGFSARGLSFYKFASASIKLSEVFKEASLCYAISVPLTVGIAAMRIKKKYNLPFIFEVGDLWPDAPIQLGFINNFFLKRALYSLEKKIYDQAESIVGLSPEIQNAIQSKVRGKTVHLLPNMADCDFYQPQITKPANKIYSKEKKFVISYIGAIGFANGLDYFLECANTCRKQDLPIQFIMCGDGAVKERLIGHAHRLGLTNISFVDFQTRDGVKQILDITDASFVCYKDVPILETGSPNKFFDGLAGGKLIVVNFGGWIKAEIEDTKCGIYVNPRQPLDFANKIRIFLDDDVRLAQFQRASRTLGETKYSRQLITEKFIEIITQRSIR